MAATAPDATAPASTGPAPTPTGPAPTAAGLTPTPTIPLFDLLKKVAVGKKENLFRITDALNMEPTRKATKAELLLSIENTVKENSQLENRVRDLANLIIQEFRKEKTNSTPSGDFGTFGD